MKKIYSLTLLALSVAGAQAATEWNVQGTKFTVDTVYHATVGPGTTQTELFVTSQNGDNSYSNHVYYSTIDLTNQYVEMRVAKGQDNFRALETVKDMATRKSATGAVYFTGVNGDFFNMSSPYNPIGMVITNGALSNFAATAPDIPSTYLIMDDKKTPLLADSVGGPEYHAYGPTVAEATHGTVTYPDGTTNIYEFNDQRWENQLILYTPQYEFTGGTGGVGHTGQNQWGAEIQIRPTGSKAMFGQEIEVEAICDPTSPGVGGNMEIPSDGFVLSGHGTSRADIVNLKKGDKFKITFPFTANGVSTVAQEVCGGYPIILRNNNIEATPSYPEHLVTQQPRTAVGYNAERTKMVILVVDGRRGTNVSAGVTTSVLASFMQNLGCAQAMNLDGGGSSQIYVKELGLRNVPIGDATNVRSVVNGLFAVSLAPEDNAVATIEFEDKAKTIASGETYTPTVYAYNQYGALLNTKLTGFTLSAPTGLGTVSGTTLTANGNGTYALTATYGNATASIPVTVTGGLGVNGITADDNATTEYFSTLGYKIENPEAGQIVIVRRGTKVTKEIVK